MQNQTKNVTYTSEEAMKRAEQILAAYGDDPLYIAEAIMTAYRCGAKDGGFRVANAVFNAVRLWEEAPEDGIDVGAKAVKAAADEYEKIEKEAGNKEPSV